MIVTTGKRIKIQIEGFCFVRSSETPGTVLVESDKDDEVIELRANPAAMEAFIGAYRRICDEDVGYREQKVE